MDDANCSQISLNYLEMEIGDQERSEINESILDNTEYDEPKQMEIVDPQEHSQDCNNEKIPTERLPVKMRLGPRPSKTPSQERLRNQASPVDVTRKKFNIKRICYSNAMNSKRNFNYNVSSNYGAKSSGPRTTKVNFSPTTKNLNEIRPSPLASSTSIPMPVPPPYHPGPPPCLTLPPPPLQRGQLTEFMIKNLAGELVASASSKYDIKFNISDIENVIRTARRY